MANHIVDKLGLIIKYLGDQMPKIHGQLAFKVRIFSSDLETVTHPTTSNHYDEILDFSEL